ncbi:MAG: carboxypeptidase regulatory-like domain-containing protein [Saprospiraceae bacterium]|nr:carboxypeptidase regulatory-like domain-containing protein [Saprospiraceae bacterium]
MQKQNWLLSLLLLLGMCFTSCEDNDPFVSGPTVEVAFAGQVINENNEPVSGALVKAGDEATLTDANGVFRLTATRLPGDHALVTVEKSGYFSFNRAYQVKNKSIQSLTIQLLEQTEVGSLNGGSGGTVQVPGGARLIFPANAIANANGAPYSGSVRVIARFLDPTDRHTMSLSMPGNLSAINAAGELRQLATFGMIGVELYAANGQKLNVAAGEQVEIRVPIDPSIVSSAPDNMPLWHYNEADGYWLEEGLAKKSGNEYVGQVSHFSWWNYDAPYPSINASGHVYFNNLQTPAVGVHVWIGPADQGMGWGCGHGQTDMDGFYSGAIAKDMPLKVWVTQYSTACNGNATLYTADIGPFSADVTLPDIIITNVPNLQTINVQGRLVDCNNAPVTNGYARLIIDNSYPLVIFTDNDGLFSHTYATCTAAPVGGNVIGYDLTELKESAMQNFTFSNNTANLGDIAVCTSLSEFIQ